ncbi:hypothetical protein Syun_016966 [Stephania yunnanensis]|uniref:Uncharacterized protein n=1 Tax=Stephania yunnanensis TaxID=152371 RepID=A0AAP0P2X3_9MAGN
MEATYKSSLLNEKPNVFHTPIPLEDGDMVIKRDEIGPYVTISTRLQDLMNKQMENTLVVKLLGRKLGFHMLCNRIKALWDLKREFYVRDLKNVSSL